MKKSSIVWPLIAIIIIIIIVIFSTAGSDRGEGERETIKIGVSLPLSGEAASFGQAGLGGIKLAQKEINEKGGILGKQIEFVVEDDQCDPTEGANVWNKLVNIDKPISIIGPVCSVVGNAVLLIAQEDKIPTVISGSDPELSKIGDYIFRNSPHDFYQGIFVADYLFNKLGKRKIALLYIQNNLGIGIKNAFKNKFEELGGELVLETAINPEQSDFKTEITKIKNSEAEGVYFVVHPNNAIDGIKQFKELGYNKMIFGNDAFGTEEVQKVGFTDEIIYSIAKVNVPEKFTEKVKAISDVPVNLITSLSYDALYIMAQAIERAGSLDRSKIRDELSKTSYKGVALPLVEFDENGDLKESQFEVRIIKDGKSEVYEF